MEYRFITIIAAAKIRNIPLTALTALEEVFLIKQIRLFNSQEMALNWIWARLPKATQPMK